VRRLGGADLAPFLSSVEGRLRATVAATPGAVSRAGGETLHAGGKRLRPTLVYLSSPIAGRSTPAVEIAAAAVELVHMATLVHDDVLDAAHLRRGVPTVYAEGGRGAATATGDLLFSRAFAELASTRSAEAVGILSRASSALARGELMQRADAWSASVAPERYLERCELKTASLFAGACCLGALLGDAAESAAALGGFGRRIGLAFQILDDVLDVSGPAERTGKQRGADLLDGTVTLPLILARERDAELARMDLREVVTGPAQADAVCDRIALTGALGQAREQALGYVAEAKASLQDVSLPADRLHALELVADGVVERYA
jgi:geranylgeranyl pyrophosphate synthase